MKKIVIALGGNMGNVTENFALACRELAAFGVQKLEMSRIHQTAPVDCAPGTPDFCNAVLTGYFDGEVIALLHCCQQLERRAGRPENHGHNTSRPLDLDLILFGNEVIHTPELVVPHPRASIRHFVLEPLCELAPDTVFPDSGRTAGELLEQLR